MADQPNHGRDIETFIDELEAHPDEEFVITREGHPAAVLLSVQRAEWLTGRPIVVDDDGRRKDDV